MNKMNDFLSHLNQRASWGHIKWHHKPFLTAITEYGELNRKTHLQIKERKDLQSRAAQPRRKEQRSEAVWVWLPRSLSLAPRSRPYSPPFPSALASQILRAFSSSEDCVRITFRHFQLCHVPLLSPQGSFHLPRVSCFSSVFCLSPPAAFPSA